MSIAAMGILCCRITIEDAGPSNPMRVQNGMEITEVQSLGINESCKKLIRTTKIIFPKGSVCRSTTIGNVTLEGRDVSRITTGMIQGDVIIGKHNTQRLVGETTFKVGQRISIKLGYDGVLKNMSDGYITGYNSDSTLEIQYENIAYKLRLKQAPRFEAPAKGTTVSEVLEGKYNILRDTGFRIHSDTKQFKVHIGKIKITGNFTVADILSEWSKYKVCCFLKYDANDDGTTPSIVVGRPYSSSKAQPVFPEDESTGPYRMYFNEHVAQSNLKVVRTDPKFLAVTGKALGTGEEFFEMTVCVNPGYDPATPGSRGFQTVNATQISKKTHKVMGDTTASGAKIEIKVGLPTYTIVPYISPHARINSDWLVEETTGYLQNYNLNGITGNATVFGNFGLPPVIRVELIDYRDPSKNDVCLAGEVTTTFGVGGYRQ